MFRSPSLFYLLVHSRCRGFLIFHLLTLKDTPHSVGLLWTRDRPVAETSTWQYKHCTRQISMPPLGFEATIPASARPQTYALDRAATGIGPQKCTTEYVNTVSSVVRHMYRKTTILQRKQSHSYKSLYQQSTHLWLCVLQFYYSHYLVQFYVKFSLKCLSHLPYKQFKCKLHYVCVCVCVKIALKITFLTKDSYYAGVNCLWRNFQISHHRKRTLVFLRVWESGCVHTPIWANSNNMQSMPDEDHLPLSHTTGLTKRCCVHILQRRSRPMPLSFGLSPM
jgi:hypothetical protein